MGNLSSKLGLGPPALASLTSQLSSLRGGRGLSQLRDAGEVGGWALLPPGGDSRQCAHRRPQRPSGVGRLWVRQVVGSPNH